MRVRRQRNLVGPRRPGPPFRARLGRGLGTSGLVRSVPGPVVNRDAHLWLTEMLTGEYTNFGTIGGGALEMVAKSHGVEVGQVRLVAAHAWDVVGAMRAGCAAAFVARPGMVLNPLAARPDLVGADLREVAAQILEIETTS